MEEWYLATSTEALVAVHYPQTPGQKSIRSEAIRFISEAQTFEWLRACNVRGSAPSSASVADQYAERMQNLNAEAHMGASCNKIRWNIRFGSLKLREAMPAQELHDKAWDTKHMFETCCLYRFRFVAAMGYSFVGPFTDPVSGPQYVAFCTFLLGRARVVPNSGPKIGV